MKYFYISCHRVKQLLILLFIGLLSLNLSAQTVDFDMCGTPDPEYPDPIGVYSRSEDPMNLNNFDPVTFNIFFWGINKSDGSYTSGGSPLTMEKAILAVEGLNNAFNQYKICFVLKGIDTINSTTHHNNSNLTSIKNYAYNNGYKKENSFNVFVPYRLAEGSGVATYNRTYLALNDVSVVDKVIIHEIGHSLNLVHTHGPGTKINAQWLTSNCERVTRDINDPVYNATPTILNNNVSRGDHIRSTSAVPAFLSEQREYIWIALMNGGYSSADAEDIAKNGFAGHLNYQSIVNILLSAGFPQQEIDEIAINGYTPYKYIDANTCEYIGNGKDFYNVPYIINQSDVRNHMSYAQKPCRDRFTIEQVIRMHEAIEDDVWGEFAAAKAELPYDLYIRDHKEDIGQEPNIHTDIFWNSPDIWVRNQPDGFTVKGHQNPEYSPTQPNYVYVRIRNNSCQASSGSDILKVYWAKTTTSLIWPNNWDGSWVINGVTMGNQIPPLSIPVIPVIEPGGEVILEIPWMVPNPEDFPEIPLNAYSKWHFSLLARIVSVNDPMTITEGIYTPDNVENNNNIAWKGTTVVDLIPNLSTAIGGVVGVYNSSSQTKSYNLKFFKDPEETGKPIYEEAEAAVTLDSTLFAIWGAGGYLGSNYTSPNLAGNKLTASGDNMILSNIELQPDQYATMYVTFNFLTKELTSKDHFVYHIVQEDYNTGQVYGGTTFEINKQSRSVFSAFAGDDETIGMNDEITIYADSINEDAVYNWYDPEGNLIYTGTDLTVSPAITQTYKLEVIADTDGYKDYAEITINITPYHIESLVPNPASNQVTVNYDVEGATSAYLMLVNQTTSNSNNYILDLEESSVIIGLSAYQSGLYTVILVCDGEIYSTKNLAKN